jgi:hypothetical protein
MKSSIRVDADSCLIYMIPITIKSKFGVVMKTFIETEMPQRTKL